MTSEHRALTPSITEYLHKVGHNSEERANSFFRSCRICTLSDRAEGTQMNLMTTDGDSGFQSVWTATQMREGCEPPCDVTLGAGTGR